MRYKQKLTNPNTVPVVFSPRIYGIQAPGENGNRESE